jgi:serine/threonine-protein kinase
MSGPPQKKVMKRAVPAGGRARHRRLRQDARVGSGRYTILKTLGRGAFGFTYEAIDQSDGARVAIKELSAKGARRAHDSQGLPCTIGQLAPDVLRRKFCEEGELLARIQHPSIVGLVDRFEERGRLYMVQEHLGKHSLDHALRRLGPLPEPQALAVFLHVAAGLETLHALGFLHRDVKPDNIMLTPAGQAVLIDFGLTEGFSPDYTGVRTGIASCGYAPIEQHGTDGECGPPSDVYALAATLFHMLTGKRPQAATDRVLADKLSPPDESATGLSRTVSAGVAAALDMDPSARPQSVADFAAALELALPTAPFPRLPLPFLYDGTLDRGWLRNRLGRLLQRPGGMVDG